MISFIDYLDTWLWSNDTPLKETPVYRFWVDNNKDILAFDCGVLWLARNTSVLTAAACAEQASRPYVCKHSMFYIWVFFKKQIDYF
jgi:hypothetical protein